jgi:hypothetical protein
MSLVGTLNNPNNRTAQSGRGFTLHANKNVSAILNDLISRLPIYYAVFNSLASFTDKARSDYG